MPPSDERIEASPGRRIGNPRPLGSDERVEVSPERRIGNPRPLGRVLPVIPSSGHGVVSDVRTRILLSTGRPDDVTGDPPPFFPISILDLGGTFEVTLNPGVVASWNPRSGEDTLDLQTPEVNGELINADPRPKLTVSPGEWVSMKIKTDPQNQITEPPEVAVMDSDGTHYIPEVADTEPRDGEYFVKLFKIDLIDDAAVVTSGVQSDILLSPYLWSGRNVGGGIGRPLKDYDASDSVYRFRTHGNGYGVETKEVGDTIEPWFVAQNVGTGVDFYVEPDPAQSGEPAEFRSLGGRGSDGSGATKQIDVRQSPSDPETNEVVGNAKVGTLNFTKNGVPAGSISWDDGLITSDGITVELCCAPSSTSTPGP